MSQLRLLTLFATSCITLGSPVCLLVSVLALSNILVNSDMHKFPRTLGPFPVFLLLLHVEKKDNIVGQPWAELLTQPFSEPTWLKRLG